MLQTNPRTRNRDENTTDSVRNLPSSEIQHNENHCNDGWIMAR